ncbi:hypothetical protein [Desulfurococcus amylolyticus]|uniref:Uncharacterized protein n=1 Tax=Desulfurococcus amylolyticus DSM 16532 TaxID=768672 RepID=I3XSR2_DESAM|nr:hypothetical protein [Desulfurococcus amylolyticus]AFL66986.1 hypothetical protein Desfe_1114 [Desulfurococcus amylolyticus DSM 16532]
MYRGEILVIGDEYLSLIGVAGGASSIVYNGNCSEIIEKLRPTIGKYSVLITYKQVLSECRRLLELVDESRTLIVELDKPVELAGIDIRQYYAEIAKKYLGIEIPI